MLGESDNKQGAGTEDPQQPDTGVDYETAMRDGVLAFFRHLVDHNITLAFHGTSNVVADSLRSLGLFPVEGKKQARISGEDIGGYWYATIISPQTSPFLREQIERGDWSALWAELRSVIEGSLAGYSFGVSGAVQPALVVFPFPTNRLPVIGEERPGSWGEGDISINYGKGTGGFPGMRCNWLEPPRKLRVYEQKTPSKYPDEFVNGVAYSVIYLRPPVR